MAKRTHSALKSARQAVRRRVRNRIITSSARTYVKQANALVASGDLSAAEKATRSAVVALDRAAQKGILKKNNAARRKSRLLLKLNALRAAKK
ncbi:MAG: 30S ribosomal protein S20 [Chloroflexi bacterium]|nr:30S ribosomal protein S20 [Chloroflexota bacterium]